ncbi:MAG: VOC family protein [Hyphomicrobiaceae bacterium]
MDAKDIGAEGSIVPTLRYRDVGAAIDWLCKAFGFERQLVVDRAEGGAVRYAELTFGSGMVMVGPVEDADADAEAEPDKVAPGENQVCYLFVPDAARHCARAKAAGAEIILDIDDEESHGRGYSCRDPEGHVWTFGTYDPWKRMERVVEPDRPADILRSGVGRLALGGAIVGVVLVSAAVAGWALGLAEFHGLDSEAHAGIAADTSAATPRKMSEVRELLARERSARASAERAAAEAQAQLARERSAREVVQAGNITADRTLDEIRGQLAQERSALAAAQRKAEEARQRVSLVERAAQEASEKLASERSAREAAELAKQQAQEQLTKERAAWAATEREAEADEREEKQQRAKGHSAKKVAYRTRLIQMPPPEPRPRPTFRPYARWDH